MLVRDLGDRFQIVLQPEHGELSGQIAAAWATHELSPEVGAALVLAAARHDDGWAVWERHPRLDEAGRPQIFHAVPRASLLSSYRACVDLLCAESPCAGLLVSMHVSGLQRNRYGVTGGGEPTPLEDLEPAVRTFVNEEEERQERLAAEVEIAERERWRAYWLLQVYDMISLYLGLADLSHGESKTVGIPPDELEPSVPRSGGPPLQMIPTEEPWTVRFDPFPFASSPTQLRMRRRLTARREWPSESSFRSDFACALVDDVQIAAIA